MKQFAHLLVICMLTICCTGNQSSNSVQDKTKIKTDSMLEQTELDEKKFTEDTILERNNPKAIDLSKHQIFIDTTRNSVFYSKLKNWNESKHDVQSINSSLKTINKNFKPKKIDVKDFPTHFITLRKLNNQFVLYDRCDGIDPRFEIRNNAIIFYGPLEAEAESISKIVSLTKNSIELELKAIQSKSADQKSMLKIEKIENFIYKLHYKNQKFDTREYVTTLDGIEKFDLVVNNCPSSKVMEFNGFDNIE